MASETQNKLVKPLKIGVRFKSPAIILFYEENSKYRKRIMPVRGLKGNSTVRPFTEDMKDHHSRYLKSIPDFKIEKMLRLIQNNMKGMDLEESLKELGKEFSVDPNENLNMLDDVTLRRKKEIMDMTFEKNRKRPEDPDFQYDVEVDFSKVEGTEPSVWDSEKEDLEF